MPQMAPYNWLNLFIMFNLLLISLSSFFYFNKMYNYNNLNNNNLLNKNFNLKW